MPEISCVGRDGQTRVFEVEEEWDALDNIWFFLVTSDPLPASGERFILKLMPVDDDKAQITGIDANDPIYSGMGIPEPLLTLAAQSIQRTIVSSPSWGEPGEFRTPKATAMWERMRANGHATFDEEADIYTFLP